MAGMESRRAIVITGPVGAGKTTTAMALAELLEQSDISCAMVDMDQLRWFHPTPPDDRFGSRVGLRHLAVMAESYRALGIRIFILADVIETGPEQHASAMPGYEIIVVRLAVSVDRLHERLRLRETDAQYGWHEHRAIELTEIMERNGIGDVVIQITDESPDQVALMIAQQLQLL
jgi:chloramphenicol 3-O-phosphotransferase